MIFTAILSCIVICCMSYMRINEVFIALLCICVIALSIYSHSNHEHNTKLFIDFVARKSKLYYVNPSLKLISCFILISICILSNSMQVGIVCAIIAFIMTVIIGGLDIKDYIDMLTLPITFIMISMLAILFEFSKNDIGIINLSFFGNYLIVSKLSQTKAILLFFKAFGSISMLYVLSLSTPMSDIISSLKSMKIPYIITDLMYLIYRCIFIIFDIYHTMHTSAKSRLGFVNYPTSIKTTANIYSNLLIRSYLKANKMFDAMESRCYVYGINFLKNEEHILKSNHIVVCLIIIIIVIIIHFRV